MITRRHFIYSTAVGGAMLASQRFATAGTVNAPDRSFEYGRPLMEFDYGQVQFADGPQEIQLKQTHEILMGLSEDGLLRPFRMTGGMSAPGFDLGGWYSAMSATVTFGPTTFGQWISALSRYYAITGDEPTRHKVERLVEEYAKTIEPGGTIFRLCSNLEHYLYDKLVCGFIDAYRFAGMNSALEVLARTTDVALPYLAGKAIDQLGPQGKKSSESYTVPENQFIAWQRGGDQRHLEMARQYLADEFYFGPLSRGQNVLSGRHAYSHMNALSSAAKAYLVLGDEKYLRAAMNGFAFAEQQSWATGAWGWGESFLPTPLDAETRKALDVPLTSVETLNDALTYFKWHFETPCGAYAHFKLARYLLRITRDPHYGDSMERVMYNTVLGALPLNKFGKAFYQSNYQARARKEYFDGYENIMPDEWPCCSGTLPQVAADYRISSYFKDTESVYVNLYIPSTLSWRQDGTAVSLTQSGQYPLDDTVMFETRVSQPATFALRFRIPAWTERPSLRVNGELFEGVIRPGTFATVHREWKAGDRIELKLPRELALQPIDAKHPNVAALVCGPLVLFAVSNDVSQVTRAQLLAAMQQRPASHDWVVETPAGIVRFRPWFSIKRETYTTYMNVPV